MRSKALLLAMSAALIAGSAATAFADDGEMFRRSISSAPGITEDPEPEAEHAFISYMNFRVPSQAANGDLVPIDYINIDGTLVQTLDTAKPLISVYIYGPVITFEDFSQSGFPGHGARDAFGAVSLDDGATWKTTNLSNSADLSSFTLTTDFQVPDATDPACHHEADPVIDPDAPVLNTATWTDSVPVAGYLHVAGTTTTPRARVEIQDQDGNLLFAVVTNAGGEFDRTAAVRTDAAPCEVVAVDANGLESAPLAVDGTPADCPPPAECTYLTEYPGDVTNIFHGTANNRVLAAWQSKYCNGGFPGYTGGSTADADAVAAYLGIDRTVDLYLEDLFVVGGPQLSTDYREQEEFDGEYDGVGEVPFSCLWAARGILREDPENPGTSQLVWFQAERLTSGRRDVNRIEASCVTGAGCAVTWQEDPEGLRPGEGEGAGTGWAGATTASQTDVWYSFIKWQDFDVVDVDGTPTVLADTITATGRPKPYVPMMVPVRLTNNARCSVPVDGKGTYCEEAVAGPYGIKNQCVGTVDIPLGPQGNLQPVCVVDANDSDTMDYGDLPNLANTAASRPRLNLQPRDSDGDDVVDDAWVVIIHEEDKGLGRYGFLNDVAYDPSTDNLGVPCGDPDVDKEDNCTEADIGKNQWYISFAMGTPQTSAALEEDFGMVNHSVAQQDMWNAPEVNWRTGTFYPPMSTADMWNFGDTLNYEIVQTEIARRASLMSQPAAKALEYASGDEALVAFPLFKEGIINQGGPADIMARRITIPLEQRCDSDNPGPGPGGVQPTLEEATLTCDYEVADYGSVELNNCVIDVSGYVCVEGQGTGTNIILDIYSGGDENVDLCEGYITTIVTPFEGGVEFEGSCDVEDDVFEDYGVPCTVKVVTGPGSTTGQGQVSDPIELDTGDLPVECVDY